MQYTYKDKSDQVVGPVDEAELQALVNSGQIDEKTQVFSDSGQLLQLSLSAPEPPKSRGLSVPSAPPVKMPPPRQSQQCPFCGELILAIAKKCKHCGETLDVAMRAAQEAQRMAARGSGGGGAAASSSSTVVYVGQNRSFPHFIHLILTIFTLGLWFPIWILHYIFRSRG